MNRVLPALALAVSVAALVLASLALRRVRPAERVPEERSVAAPAAAAAAPAPAAEEGLLADEAERIARDAVRKRETEIVDRTWRRVARMREAYGLPAAPRPSTLDGLLALMLVDGGEAETEGPELTPEERAKMNECRNDMKQIGIYFALFESKHRYYPGSLDDIKAPDLLSDPEAKILKCPFDTSGDATSYEYLHPVRGDNEPPDMIMAYDRHAHPDGRRCVLYFQGRVDVVTEADFQKQFGEQIAQDRTNLPDEIVKLRTAVLDPGLAERDKQALTKRLSILETLRR